MRLMLREIEIATVRNAFELAETGRCEGEAVFDVRRAVSGLGVVRKLVGFVITHLQVRVGQAHRLPEFLALGEPEIAPHLGFVAMAEPFHFHLLKLARTENKVTRVDLVAEGFADLRNPERHTHTAGIENVFEIEENPLRRFGAQIYLIGIVFDWPCVRFKHQVELLWLS